MARAIVTVMLLPVAIAIAAPSRARAQPTPLAERACPGPSLPPPGSPVPAPDPSPAAVARRERADRVAQLGTAASAREALIVRVRVIETGEMGGRHGRERYAIFRVLEVLRGDAREVLPRYRRAFPLRGPVEDEMIFDDGAQSPASSRPEAYVRGEQWLLSVVLPTRSSQFAMNGGPSGPLLRRFGPHDVAIQARWPVERAETVIAELEERARRLREERDAAPVVTARDRFRALAPAPAGALPDEATIASVARGVADFVRAHWRERLAVELAFAAAPIVTVAGPSAVHRIPFTAAATDGTTLPDGALVVSILRASGIVTSWSIEWPGLHAYDEESAAWEPGALPPVAAEMLALRIEGGSADAHATSGTRGDGLGFVTVRWSALARTSPTTRATTHSLEVDLTPRCLALYRYARSWGL